MANDTLDSLAMGYHVAMQSIASVQPIEGGNGWSLRLVSLGIALACASPLVLAAMLTPSAEGMGTHKQMGLPECGFVTATGLPCATCGCTTAFAHAADGSLLTSLATQPFGAMLALALAMSIRLMLVAIESKSSSSATRKLVSSDGGLYGCTLDAKASLLRAPAEGTTFERVACGRGHCLAVTTDGRVFTWGDGERGQLGLGRDVADGAAPVCMPTQVQFGKREMIVRVAAGEVHSLACTSAGKLYAWGDGGDGRLGLDDESGRRRMTPTELPPPAPIGDEASDYWQVWLRSGRVKCPVVHPQAPPSAATRAAVWSPS